MQAQNLTSALTRRAPRNRSRRRLGGSDGSVTIEVLLWLPIVLLVIAFVTDTALIYSGGITVTRVLNDASRNTAVARFDEEEEVEAYVRNRLALISPNVQVESKITTSATKLNENFVVTAVAAPFGDFEVFGLLSTIRPGGAVLMKSVLFIER